MVYVLIKIESKCYYSLFLQFGEGYMTWKLYGSVTDSFIPQILIPFKDNCCFDHFHIFREIVRHRLEARPRLMDIQFWQSLIFNQKLPRIILLSKVLFSFLEMIHGGNQCTSAT